MPSLVGPEQVVNPDSLDGFADAEVDVASSPNGNSVVAWTFDSGFGDTDVFAQLYDSRGRRIGNEINVATVRREDDPAVAMDSKGRFVVAWHENIDDDHAIRFARYGASGRLRQAGTVAEGAVPVSDPSVAMDSGGRFVVSYTRVFGAGSDMDVEVALFRADGVRTRTLRPTDNPDVDSDSDVAFSDSGTFSLVYTHSTGGPDDVVMRRFTASGGALSVVTIANTSRDEDSPSVSMDALGNAVVAYTDEANNDDILAVRVDRFGIASSPIMIDNSMDDSGLASVALDRKSGAFVVAYENTVSDTTFTVVREVSRSHVVGGPMSLGGSRFRPRVSIDKNGLYHVAYNDAGIDPTVRDQFGLLFFRD